MIHPVTLFLLLKLLLVPNPNPLNTYFQKQNLPDGEHKYYFANGVISESAYLKNGNLQGNYYTFYFDGQKAEVLHFDNGHFNDVKNDTNLAYDDEGNLLYKDVFAHDTLLFTIQYAYYKNGTRESAYTLTFDKDSLTIFPFYKTKEKINYLTYDANLSIKNLKSHGKYLEYYKSGVLSDETDIVDEKYEGDYRSYYESGKLYGQGTYHNDVEDGTFTYYNEDGTVSETEIFIKGKKVKQ